MRSLLRKNSPAGSFSYARHSIFEQVMEAQHLTVGLILPLETHAGPAPTMADHLAMVSFSEDDCTQCQKSAARSFLMLGMFQKAENKAR